MIGDTMNNKGFSLTELIVTFVIMGIILSLAFPAVGRLQRENKKQIYKTYENAVEHAAKLYVDQYDIDIWGKGQYGCVRISYTKLRSEDFIKAFNDKDENDGKNEYIDNTLSYVNVTKNATGDYSVEAYIVIKKGSTKVYESTNISTGCRSV